jgi:hypothetical protein
MKNQVAIIETYNHQFSIMQIFIGLQKPTKGLVVANPFRLGPPNLNSLVYIAIVDFNAMIYYYCYKR